LRKIKAALVDTCQFGGIMERFEFHQGGSVHARTGLFLCVVIVLIASLVTLMYICLYGGWPWP